MREINRYKVYSLGGNSRGATIENLKKKCIGISIGAINFELT